MHQNRIVSFRTGSSTSVSQRRPVTPNRVRKRPALHQPPSQHRGDLVLGARPGVHELRAAREPATEDRDQGVIVAGTGVEAMPFATTTSVLGPGGVRRGSVNSVVDGIPGAVEKVLQLCVRA
jgi:hypothetical protein